MEKLDSLIREDGYRRTIAELEKKVAQMKEDLAEQACLIEELKSGSSSDEGRVILWKWPDFALTVEKCGQEFVLRLGEDVAQWRYGTETEAQHAAESIVHSGKAQVLVHMPSQQAMVYDRVPKESYERYVRDFLLKIGAQPEDCVQSLACEGELWRKYGILAHEYSTGPDGARFELFTFPEHTKETIAKAKGTLRNARDVVGIEVFQMKFPTRAEVIL